MEGMQTLLYNPAFGIGLTFMAFEFGVLIQKTTKISLLNPLMLAIGMIVLFLQVSGIPYEAYNEGGAIISFFLAPTTVVLAVPLYRKFSLLRANGLPILIGIIIGSSMNIALIIGLSRYFGLDKMMERSLIPKSITTPIGISLSHQLGGYAEITVAAIIITGITGAIAAPLMFKLLKIEDPVAKGIALGTSAHALGTVKAMEIGETEGAMSSLAIGIAGLVTVLLAPLFIRLLG